MSGNEKVMWSVYWTHMANGFIISPLTRDTAYTHEDINECYRELAANIAETKWQGYVDECRD